jgi:hypothetical protein
MRLIDRIETVPEAERDSPPTELQVELQVLLARMRGESLVAVPDTRGEMEEELRRLWAL